jgi:predicted nucleotide-binding protein with TIR-like domain
VKPRLFVGSSSEGLKFAYALQENLESDAEITVWDQGIFEPSRYVLESLLDTLQSSDLGVFVFSPDDVATIRGTEAPVVRDNVLFELGLFVGRLGRHRSIFLVPKGSDLHIPSDLHGVTAVPFEPNRTDGNLKAALGPAANRIRNTLKNIKPLNASGNATTPEMPPELKLPWFERRVLLTPTQQKLLSVIEDRQPVAKEYLLTQFPGRSEAELFYRIEQLRLLGFTTRTGDEHAFLYQLSDSYGKAYYSVRRQTSLLAP